MSTTPTVATYLVQEPLTGNQQSFKSTWTDVGYFYYTSPNNTTMNTNWYSLKARLLTSNGIIISNDDPSIANIEPTNPANGGTAGFRVGQAGIYRLSYAIDVPDFSTSGTGSIYFGFGGSFLANTPTGSIPTTNSFFGNPVSIESYGLSARNQTYPAILSWVHDGFSTGTSTLGVFTRISNYLMYQMYGTGSSGAQTAYLSSGTIVFAVDAANVNNYIFMQYSANTNTTIGYSPFRIELLSTTVPTVPSDPNA